MNKKGGGAMISRETIEEILLRTDIQTLIGGYVSLKRANANLKGLCPFHSEKTPSFTVYPANNRFYCGAYNPFLYKRSPYPRGISTDSHRRICYDTIPSFHKSKIP